MISIGRRERSVMASPRYTATDATAYERLIGRRSRLRADEPLAVAGFAPGDRLPAVTIEGKGLP